MPCRDDRSSLAKRKKMSAAPATPFDSAPADTPSGERVGFATAAAISKQQDGLVWTSTQ